MHTFFCCEERRQSEFHASKKSKSGSVGLLGILPSTFFLLVPASDLFTVLMSWSCLVCQPNLFHPVLLPDTKSARPSNAHLSSKPLRSCGPQRTGHQGKNVECKENTRSGTVVKPQALMSIFVLVSIYFGTHTETHTHFKSHVIVFFIAVHRAQTPRGGS